MLRVSYESRIKGSKDIIELREVLENLNSEIQRYEDDSTYRFNEKEYINYSNLVSLQREAKIKIRKYTNSRF